MSNIFVPGNAVGLSFDDLKASVLAVIQDSWSKATAAVSDTSHLFTILRIDVASQPNQPNVPFNLVDNYPFGSVSDGELESKVQDICNYLASVEEPGDRSLTLTAVSSVDAAGYFNVSENEADPIALFQGGRITEAELQAFFTLNQQLANSAVAGGPVDYDYTLYAAAASGRPGLASDFNANGYDDVLFFNEVTSSVGKYEMPSGDWGVIGTAGANWEVRGLGLFDDDDSGTDILWFNTATRAVGRFDMENGSSAGWAAMGRAGVNWQVAGAGDFNGDDIDDVLWINEVSNSVGQFRIGSDGSTEWRGIGSTGSAWEFAGLGDFNNDSVDDILWANTATGAIGQFQMSASGKVWNSITTMSAGYAIADTGDFDADGYEDILVYNEATRKLGYYDLGPSGTSWVSLGGYGAGWELVGTGDFDGSGTDDILWRHSDGRIGQYQMDGADRTWDSVGFASSAWDVML